ncbi:MAG TPA: cell division protein FtsQ/DivIB [Albitalea sp.]|uniref:cell division protein FtsQ/DivIB n=1 Tax=Piscinibacter sp. TaxID=1903157 RepID=UPI002ED07D35
MARRAPAFTPSPSPLPGDVRLMHVTANALYVLAGLALAALAVNLAMRMPAFSLRAIRIEGDVLRNSVSTIRANAAPKLAGNFFTADLVRGKHAFESVPWVRQAIVKRVWPNRLAVRLEEHRPAAVWGGGDSATDRLVNTYGEVFEANIGDVEDDSLPTLSGPDGSSMHMLSMLNRLKPGFERLDARIDALALSGRGSWRVELDTGAEIELGRGSDDEVLARTDRFIGTLTQVTSRFQRPLEYADLRHHDGYAVRLKGITTVIPSAKERKN